MKKSEPVPEFNEEQLAYMQKQIIEDRTREHRAIAGDQGYRLACFYINQDVQRGLCDPEILRTIGEEWQRFNKENPVLGKKIEKPQPEKQE